MGYDFNGKTALITGGSSGIGLAAAVKLAEEGVNLWLFGRRVEVLEQAKGKVAAKANHPGQIVEINPVDVTQADQVDQAVAEIIERAGNPDILINSAGITEPGYIENLDLESFKAQMDINYMGTVNTVRAVLPGMVQRGSGSIVNISSFNGIIGVPGYTGYCASKFAVRGFSEALRFEVKRKGIHVAVVYPPDTDTPQLVYDKLHRPPEISVLAGLDDVLSPDAVAEEIIKGIRRKTFMIIPGSSNKFWYWAQSLTGTLFYSFGDLMFQWAINKANHNGPGEKNKN